MVMMVVMTCWEEGVEEKMVDWRRAERRIPQMREKPFFIPPHSYSHHIHMSTNQPTNIFTPWSHAQPQTPPGPVAEWGGR